jgi:hypothetical protein
MQARTDFSIGTGGVEADSTKALCFRGHITWRDENENRVGIDEAANQPGGSRSINLDFAGRVTPYSIPTQSRRTQTEIFA